MHLLKEIEQMKNHYYWKNQLRITENAFYIAKLTGEPVKRVGLLNLLLGHEELPANQEK